MKGWHEQYQDRGLVVIGNHYPQTPYERDLGHLKQAVADLGIQYPVAQDNEARTWTAYRAGYWPTLYLIDKRGRLRYTHVGQGRPVEVEAAILALLAETP